MAEYPWIAQYRTPESYKKFHDIIQERKDKTSDLSVKDVDPARIETQEKTRQAQMEALSALRSTLPQQAAIRGTIQQDIGSQKAAQALGAGATGQQAQQIQNEQSLKALQEIGQQQAEQTARARNLEMELAQSGIKTDTQVAIRQAELNNQAQIANQQKEIELETLRSDLVKNYIDMGLKWDEAQQQAMLKTYKLRLAEAIRAQDLQADLQSAAIKSGAANDASTFGLIGSTLSALGSVGAAVITSDRRLKHDIKDGTINIDEFLGALKSYGFKYNNADHGPGDRHGIMVQDIENTEIGKTLVRQLPDGKKGIDIAQGLGAALSGIARLNEKIEKLQGKK